MRVVKVIQPHEFGDNFILEDGKWKVKFPPIATSGVEVSKDANNLITLGGDGGMFADATRLHAYALVQDNENMKIHLYRHQADLEFDVASATLINSIDMLELNGQFDDITITDAVVTFKDVQTDTELEFDTDQFQQGGDLYFDWPLSAEKDDKFKVGATDRIEITLVAGTTENQGDYTEFNVFDNVVGDIITYRFEGDSQTIADELNANIDSSHTGIIAFELVSVVEVRQTTETKLAIVNLGGEHRYLELHLYTHRVAEIAEPVKVEVTGSPSYVWVDRQYNYSGLSFYLAANGTTIEDNGISPTASVIDLTVDVYDNALVKTASGLLVLSPGTQIEHTLEARSHQVEVPDDELDFDEFVRTINGNEIRIPAVTLKNSRGKTLAAIVAPISEKLPIPTSDRITIDTNTSILDSRVLINGVDKGSFVDLSLNQIPELQFTLISASSYSGGDGYTIETEGYQFVVHNNTQKRLRVTIAGFNAINLNAYFLIGANSLTIGNNKVGFDLAPRFVD